MSTGPWADVKPCGTRAAYQRHLRHKETPCQACAEANRQWQSQQRAALREALDQEQAEGRARLAIATAEYYGSQP